MIEDVIPEYLDGEVKALALDFVAWLRMNRMSPTWASGNSWKSSYKGKGICYVKLFTVDRGERNNFRWAISLLFNDFHRYEQSVVNEGMHEIFTAKPWYCHGCGRPSGESCGRKRDVVVGGKELIGVCGNNYLTWANDPNETAVTGIKRLIELEKAARTA